MNKFEWWLYKWSNKSSNITFSQTNRIIGDSVRAR